MSWSCLSKPTTPARERSRGFTLIELMMVVVIIGIMSAIAIGAYTKNIRKARQTQVVANLSKLSLREAAVFSLRGHYASTTNSEDVTNLYPEAGKFNQPCADAAGGTTCEAVPWIEPMSDTRYTGEFFGGGLYFQGGDVEHGFDVLSFIPDGGRSRCGYGVISGLGSQGRLPNGQPVSEEPPFGQPLASEIWNQNAWSLYQRDWFYAVARCDFDRDAGSGNWGGGNTWDFTLTHVDSNVTIGLDGAT